MPPGSVPGKYQAASRGQAAEISHRGKNETTRKTGQPSSGCREAAGKPGFARIKMGKHHDCYGLSPRLRRFCRTFNHIERLNREVKCRSSVIGIFPHEEPLVRGGDKRSLRVGQ